MLLMSERDWAAELCMLAAQATYLLLPLLASVALSGVVMRYDLMPKLKRPIDGGAHFRGRRLFGDNKTWRGLVCSIIGCTLMVAAQKYVVGDRARAFAVIDYQSVNVFVFGLALGAGAIVGELPNSFAKRRLGVSPGGAAPGAWGPVFYVGDQIDCLVVLWPVLLIWVRPGWSLVLVSLILVFLAHQLLSLIGYLIGARSDLFY